MQNETTARLAQLDRARAKRSLFLQGSSKPFTLKKKDGVERFNSSRDFQNRCRMKTWKTIKKGDYLYALVPDHPNATSKKYVLEHSVMLLMRKKTDE